MGRPLEHPECGAVQTYWRGCRCKDCRVALTNYQRDLKMKRIRLGIGLYKRRPKPPHIQEVLTNKEKRLIAYVLGERCA